MRRAGHLASNWRPLFGAGCAALLAAPLLGGLGLLLAEGVVPSHLQRLLAQPGLWHSAALSFWIGTASTLGSLLLTALLLAHSGQLGAESRAFSLLHRLLSPLLALPHVAFAIGLAFLLAPSGWLLRLVSPALTGFEFPPTGRPSRIRWALG